ncbi:response regulator [Desulfitobacterium hafniense]|uniref:Stage 0 sporulation protein A homolog n=1 Tax=Desulfitobacterium hafniense (strain Y51) TaxID=138119 RepID=Q24Z68_DESHY|nr:response regulator transcription factor [Desulfitobacterium hafniense]BAE82674.1 hypothetical protein DSY0885 [Desulfitobacterium hafniense Y51]
MMEPQKIEQQKIITVFLADDHHILRQSLGVFLDQQRDLGVVGQAGTAEQAVREALHLRPDVILMDIDFLDFSGIEATIQIRKEWPEARILALTMHSEENYLLPFLDAGGCGYLHKSAADTDLIRAIRMAAQGQVFLRPEGLAVLTVQQKLNKKQKHCGGEPVLTERETQVLGMVARGYTSKEIGEKLYIAPSTVDTYRERLIKKLEFTTRAQLVDYAILHDIFYKGD